MGTIATLAAPPAQNARTEADRTDEELVAAVRLGDDRAFECLWQRYQRRIAAYVNGMVNDHARAEDITQDVFMSALRRMRETDRAIAFKPWIYEIAKNACIDAFRRSRRAEEVSYDAEAPLASADQGKLVAQGQTPDAAVETRMSLDDLRGAFGGLSETHHDILVMRELEGLSYREIGERMGMSRPSVESTLFRARKRLSEEYEDLVSGERCRRVQATMVEAAAASLGARDGRRLAKHVSHCQPCRRQAVLAGIDLASIAPRPLREKVAALLPFPLPAFLRKRGGDDAGAAASMAAQHGPLAQWATSIVGSYAEPAALSGWAKAAAAAATIGLAGVGAGVATDTGRSMFSGPDEGGVSFSGASGGSGSDGLGASGASLVPSSGAAASPDGGSAAAMGARDAAGPGGGTSSGGASGASGTSGSDTGAGGPSAGPGAGGGGDDLLDQVLGGGSGGGAGSGSGLDAGSGSGTSGSGGGGAGSGSAGTPLVGALPGGGPSSGSSTPAPSSPPPPQVEASSPAHAGAAATETGSTVGVTATEVGASAGAGATDAVSGLGAQATRGTSSAGASATQAVADTGTAVLGG